MKFFKKILFPLITLLLVSMALNGCSPKKPENETIKPVDEEASEVAEENIPGTIILSTTTSTEDSGLLDYLLPIFKKETGIDVKVVAVGTGKALENGRAGNADILLVHAKPSEEEFVEEGHGLRRSDVMYNDFILVGPKSDPAGLKKDSPNNILKSFNTLADTSTLFISRGDDSGTHKKELSMWEEAGIDPDGEWYLETGQGMADTLKIASEKEAYVMTDRATYLSMNKEGQLDLDILVEGDENLFNQYGVIPVDPSKSEQINGKDAEIFEEWILSEETQNLISQFGKEEFGQALFTPNAK